MALSAIALVTVLEARSVLGIPDSAQDSVIETLINEASALAENTYVLRPLKQRMISNLRVDGPLWSARLYPDTFPIATGFGVAVAVNGVAQTVWKTEADGAPESFDVEVYPDHLYRHGGWCPMGRTRRNVVLSYMGGYDPVPDDLKAATLELVAKMWGPLTQQRPDFASISGPGGSYQTLDGQWSGQSGTSGPWSLSRRTKEVFQAYRAVVAV